MSTTRFKQIITKASPEDIAAGLHSYEKYNQLMKELATGTNLRIAAAVFASLSPNNDYHGNLRDAHKLLDAAHRGLALTDFTVSTYGHNKRKAWQITNGADPLAMITAKKTRNFYRNIVDPADPEPVTIDGHMINIWRGRRENLVGLKFPAKMYDEAAEGVRQVARDFGWVPCAAQGVIWLTYRRLNNIRTSNQLELWDIDRLAARLGFHSAVTG